MKHLLLTIMCALACFQSAFAEDIWAGLFKYRLENGVAIVTARLTSNIESVTIPGKLKVYGTEYPVTEIAEQVFAGCSNLKSVTFEEGLQVIGNKAFTGTSLTHVTLPASLTKMIGSPFGGIETLTSVEVKSLTPPELVYYDEGYAFEASDNLKTLTVPANCKSAYESAEGWEDLKDKMVEADPVPVEKIYPNRIGNPMIIGEELQLSIYHDPINSNIDKSKLTWHSDNESVATVDGEGNVTAVNVGDTHISATYEDNDLKATFTIAVIPAEEDCDWWNILENGNADQDFDCNIKELGDEGWENVCAWGKTNDSEPAPCGIEEVDGNRVFVVHAPKVDETDGYQWRNQFWINAPRTFGAGDVVRVKFRYKASRECSIPTQAHFEPANYNHWEIIGEINFTDEWQEIEKTIVISEEQAGGTEKGFQSIAFNLGDAIEATDFYFDDIQLMVISENPWQKPVPETADNNSLISNADGVTEFYLYNVGMQQFLYQGEAWDTQAIVADEGLPLRAFADEPYRYFLTTPIKTDAKDYLFRESEGGYCYVDGDMDERGKSGYWMFNDLGDGTFTLTVPQDDPLAPIYYFACNKSHKTFWENGQPVTYGVYYDETELTANARWMVVSQDAYDLYQGKLARNRVAERLRQAIENAKAANKDVTDAELVYNNPESTIEEMEQAIAKLNLFESNNIWYQITSDNEEDRQVTLVCQSEYNSNYISTFTGALEIPSEVTYNDKTYTVTTIGHQAFEDCTELTSVVIPGSVSLVEWYAFINCTQLKDITMHEGVGCIQGGTFANCTSLETLHIPASLWWWGKGAFWGSDNLATFTVSDKHENLMAVDGVVYSKDGKRLEMYPNARTEATFLETTEIIAREAFLGCDKITSICLPKTVTEISRNSFNDMENLRKLVMPSVNFVSTEYADDPYENMPELTELYLGYPIDLKSDDKDFSQCTLYAPKGKKEEFEGYEFYDFSHFKAIEEADDSAFEPNNPLNGNTWEKPVPETTDDNSVISNADGETEFYLYNVGMQQFLYQGEAYGTQAVVADEGLKVKAVKDGMFRYFTTAPIKTNAGNYLFRCNDSKLTGGVGGNVCYVDGDKNKEGENGYWKFTDLGQDGMFTLTVPQIYYGDLLENVVGRTYYMACNTSHATNAVNGDTYGIWFDETQLTANARWQVVTVDAYDTYRAELLRYRAAERLADAIEIAKNLGIDVSSAQSVYSNSESTTEQLNAATASLNIYFQDETSKLWFRIMSENTVGVACQRDFNENFLDDIKDEITIPEEVSHGGKTYTVDVLLYFAFGDCSELTSVKLPTSITVIQQRAFANCEKLATVNLNEGIGWLDSYAFESCYALESITLPSTLDWMDVAFTDCPNLTNITVLKSATIIQYTIKGRFMNR